MCLGDDGGGGRIAVYYDSNQTTFDFAQNISAAATHRGGAGSVFLKDSQAQFGDLVFDNGGALSSGIRPTELFSVPGGVQTFRNFSVTGSASVTTPDTLNITGTLTVSPGSRLQSQNLNLP